MRLLVALAALWAAAANAADPTPGTVAVTLSDVSAGSPAADQPFADAVGQALGEANFTVMPAARHGRYLALVSVTRERRGVVTAAGPKGQGVTGLGAMGPMVAVPLGSGKTQLADLTATTLSVRLLAEADHRLIWSGSAVTVRTDGAAAAASLARAAVATFPHTLPAPVSVP